MYSTLDKIILPVNLIKRLNSAQPKSPPKATLAIRRTPLVFPLPLPLAKRIELLLSAPTHENLAVPIIHARFGLKNVVVRKVGHGAHECLEGLGPPGGAGWVLGLPAENRTVVDDFWEAVVHHGPGVFVEGVELRGGVFVAGVTAAALGNGNRW